jgi:FixJ family two-component response regulator
VQIPQPLEGNFKSAISEENLANIENIDAVFIDDENFNHTFWNYSAQKTGKKLKCFESLEAFEADKEAISLNTPIYIDLNLKEASGLEVAKILHERGFTQLYITTGFVDFNIADYPYLKGVRDKMPPF